MLLDRTTQQNTYSETNTDGGKAIFLICKNKPRQNRLISKHSVLLSQIYSLNVFAHRSKKWVINSRRADLDGKTATQLYNNCRMCSNHFEDSQFKDPAHKSLMHYAVPTIFESGPNPPPRIASKRQRKERHTPELHSKHSFN